MGWVGCGGLGVGGGSGGGGGNRRKWWHITETKSISEAT